MSAQTLDGKRIADDLKAEVQQRVHRLRTEGCAPRLGVLVSTDDEAVHAYVRAKARAAEKLGIDMQVTQLQDPTTEELVDWVARWSEDPSISGIVIESPIAPGVDLQAVRQALPADKDVDAAGVEALGALLSGQPVHPPATAEAALRLAEIAGPIQGKNAVILGRSLVVGRPLALMLLSRDATVTVCHSKTRDLPRITQQAELLFAAVGRPHFVTADMVKPEAVVIDIGTNMVDGRLVGDVDAVAVAPVAGALSPVPGGVGPLTTALLLKHVVDAAECILRRDA